MRSNVRLRVENNSTLDTEEVYRILQQSADQLGKAENTKIYRWINVQGVRVTNNSQNVHKNDFFAWFLEDNMKIIVLCLTVDRPLYFREARRWICWENARSDTKWTGIEQNCRAADLDFGSPYLTILAIDIFRINLKEISWVYIFLI